MKRRHHIGSCRVGLLLLAAALTACATAPRAGTVGPRPINANRIITDLTPDIESLYLSWHELDQIYKDVKVLESAFLFDPDDRQLGTIQKTGLYIQDAAVRIHHQWEQLSVLHYIRPDMMRDYLTLSVKGLTSAIKEIGYDTMFLKIYGAHIENEAVSGDLNSALNSIEKNVGLLGQILEKLLPISNSTAPPGIL